MYKVTIRNNKTNEIKSFTEDDEFDEVTEYLWSEGNYACDCNRAAYFNEEASKCIGEVYSICIEDKKGKILYSDDDW